MSTPKISILHPSARPHAWERTMREWLDKAYNPQDIEYILAYHAEQAAEFPVSMSLLAGYREPPQLLCVVNDGPDHPTLNGRSSCCGNTNAAAAASTGQLLMFSSDDFSCEKNWDRNLLIAAGDLTWEKVIHVSSCSPSDANDVYVMGICTRPWYERYGYFFHPSLSGMFIDNDFTERARRDGVVVEAKHLKFPHNHYLHGRGQRDQVYDWENSADEYARGAQTFYRRRKMGYPK